MEHKFTPEIVRILEDAFGCCSKAIFQTSELIQYLNIKTKSASRGSKSRASFGNLYAIYVLVEDYLGKSFHKSGEYKEYEGARFTDLLQRMRELPFGGKLQNHALNHRMNKEFEKYFKICEFTPILRDATTNKYWINENLLNIEIIDETFNIANVVIEIIDAYIEIKRQTFESFITTCQEMQKIKSDNPTAIRQFIVSMIQPNADARIFEIASFGILKKYFAGQSIYWGWTLDEISEESLLLYKTGRCNANDGGIDFVMRPLGRFFQVTETTDVKKYFLDIDKVQRYPITFVIKSMDSADVLREKIEQQAKRVFSVEKVVRRYMDCIEEIINIPLLLERFDEIADTGKPGPVIEEILLQSRVEFNYDD